MQHLSVSTSNKIKFLSFLCMVMVVFDHCYNLTDRYLQPFTTPEDKLSITSFTEYFVANGITRFLIPLLFCISGYLTAMRDQRPRKEEVFKRLKTLGLPFLIWSAFGLTVLYVLELFPYTRNLLASSHIAQIDGTRMYISQYRWYELLARWLLVPASYQLWFLQVLLVYNLAYPLLRWCVLHKTGRWFFFTIAVFLWLTTFGGVLIDGEGLVFFSLGIWMQKNNFNIESHSRKLNPVAWGALFVLLCAGKTWLAFNPTATAPVNAWFLMILMHKLAQFAGLVAVWFGSNALAAWCMARRWFVWLSGFSFIIYVMHAPAAAVFIDGVFAWLHYAPGYRMISFILLPLLAITICVITGATLRRIAPKFYGLITGGRGFA